MLSVECKPLFHLGMSNRYSIPILMSQEVFGFFFFSKLVISSLESFFFYIYIYFLSL